MFLLPFDQIYGNNNVKLYSDNFLSALNLEKHLTRVDSFK